jgi:hypothetical protein
MSGSLKRTSSPAPCGDPGRIRILLVGEGAVRARAGWVRSERRLAVAAVDTKEEAIACCSSVRFDVVLIDEGMSSGEARELRETIRLRDPTVACTFASDVALLGAE